jgi:hypothetical protein
MQSRSKLYLFVVAHLHALQGSKTTSADQGSQGASPALVFIVVVLTLFLAIIQGANLQSLGALGVDLVDPIFKSP